MNGKETLIKYIFVAKILIRFDDQHITNTPREC